MPTRHIFLLTAAKRVMWHQSVAETAPFIELKTGIGSRYVHSKCLMQRWKGFALDVESQSVISSFATVLHCLHRLVSRSSITVIELEPFLAIDESFLSILSHSEPYLCSISTKFSLVSIPTCCISVPYALSRVLLLLLSTRAVNVRSCNTLEATPIAVGGSSLFGE